jgi:hypothetical protein
VADEDHTPIGEVLAGLDILVLPDGYMPIEAAVVVKTLDPDGDVAWLNRYTSGLTSIEAIGSLHAAILTLGHDIVQSYMPDTEGD